VFAGLGKKRMGAERAEENGGIYLFIYFFFLFIHLFICRFLCDVFFWLFCYFSSFMPEILCHVI